MTSKTAITTGLKDLVQLYAQFDSENNAYTTSLDKVALLQLDNHFMKLLNQLLLVDGPEKHHLEKNYRTLCLYFHDDRKPFFLPEVIWLEHQLSEGNSNGICFKTLSLCFEKLSKPINFKEIEVNEIKSKEDYKKWLEKLRGRATTYSGRSLCDSLVDLLEQSSSFFDEAGKIKPQGLNALIKFIPMTLASYGAILLSEELLAIYGLYFIVLKGGQYLGHSHTTELKKLGRTLQDITTITAMTTTTILVRLLQMTFWTSQQCLDISLRIGSALLDPILAAAEAPEKSDEGFTSKVCQDLILSDQQLRTGMQFKTPQLKVIAAPFERYLILNTQQLLGNWRLGKEKRMQIEQFLFHMRVLDHDSGSLEAKLEDVKKRIHTLKENEVVYSKKAAVAVDEAEQIIELLSDASSFQLQPYK